MLTNTHYLWKMAALSLNIHPSVVFCRKINQWLWSCGPLVNFINIKRTNFLYEGHFSSFYYVHVARKKLLKQHLYEKFTCKTLMKLTPLREIGPSNNKEIKEFSVTFFATLFCHLNYAEKSKPIYIDNKVDIN